MALWRVRTEFRGVQGTPWLSTMMFGTVNSAQQSVNAVGVFWNALDARMVNTITWRTLNDVEEVGVGGELIGVTQTTPVTSVGQLAQDPLPWATQGLIRWRTGAIIGGRELKGRTFIPGLSELDNGAQGDPAGTLLTTIQNAADALIADVNSAFSVWSRRHGQVRLATVGSAIDKWAVLRSRRD